MKIRLSACLQNVLELSFLLLDIEICLIICNHEHQADLYNPQSQTPSTLITSLFFDSLIPTVICDSELH